VDKRIEENWDLLIEFNSLSTTNDVDKRIEENWDLLIEFNSLSTTNDVDKRIEENWDLLIELIDGPIKKCLTYDKKSIFNKNQFV
jgi:hypothetical protein